VKPGAIGLTALIPVGLVVTVARAEPSAGVTSLTPPQVDAEVVVTVARRSSGADASSVTAREFAFVPRRSAEDALRSVPGLVLVQHGSEGEGHQFFLRGFDAVHGADFALSVDGVPINEWSSIHAQGYIDLGFVIPEVVSSVEVTKGPFSNDQGAFAMAGSAKYRLGLALADRGWRATYTLGTTNRQRGLVTYSPPDGDGQSFLAAEGLHDDGFGQNRGIDRVNLLGRLQLSDPERVGSWTALGSLYAARFDLPGALRKDDVSAGRIGFYDAYDRGAGGHSRRWLGALTYERTLDSHAFRTVLHAGQRQLDLLENFTGFAIDPIDGDRRLQAQRTLSLGAHSDLDLFVSPALVLDASVGFFGDVFEQSQDHVDTAGATLGRERDLEGYQALFFAKAGVGFQTGMVHVTGGVRADVARVVVRDRLIAGASSGQGQTLPLLSPRLSLEAPLSEALTAFGAYGRGFRPPEARAFSGVEPEHSGIEDDLYRGGQPQMTSTDSFELGLRGRDGGRRLTGVLSAFATFIEHESVYDHVSGLNLELDGTRRLGVELELKGRATPWLEWTGFATLVDARFTESSHPIPLAPRQTAGLSFIAARERGPRAGLRALFIAPRPLPHGARGEAFFTVDMTLGWHWQRVRLDVELENLLDRRLYEGEYHYASHWQPGQSASLIPVTEFVAGPPLNGRASLTFLF
jgi:outer membrane receptor protein involved in Fe transport